MGSTQ